MGGWVCGIAGCGRQFEQPAGLIRHQSVDHPAVECQVCGESVPAGYFGIQHAFSEHNRAEFVRAYDADAEAIRAREELLEIVGAHVDLAELRTQLDGRRGEPVASADD